MGSVCRVEIRDAKPSDARQLAVLLTELLEPASGDQADQLLQRFLAHRGSRVQVAVLDEVVVGFVATHLVPRLDFERLSCRVLDLVVSSTHRRSGIGRSLMQAAESEARRARATRLDLATGFERRGAHAFYEALGYEATSQNYRKRLTGKT